MIIINNKTKEVEKYESLVRLIDESGNVLSPFHFLNVSKKGNYYSKITQRVLENSFKILHTINTKLSINISARDIEKEQTRLQIFELLEQYKDDAHRIIFELLEDESIEDFNIIKNFIHTVKAKGIQIAIDDFGAGYSNFERILDFEPDIVKIDGSLVKNIEHDMFSRNIVETIVLFAKKQNIYHLQDFSYTFNHTLPHNNHSTLSIRSCICHSHSCTCNQEKSSTHASHTSSLLTLASLRRPSSTPSSQCPHMRSIP